LKFQDSNPTCWTSDLSSHGVRFFINPLQRKALTIGESVEFEIALSPDVTLAERRSVWCVAKVVRAAGSDDGVLEFATQILNYRFDGGRA
jgi:hypothetical protein